MSATLERTATAAKGVPSVPRPREPAHVIRDDAEAIAVARRLVKDLSGNRPSATATGSVRWRNLMPSRKAGCGSINVARAFGGPEVSYATLAKVIEIFSAADSSIGQVA